MQVGRRPGFDTWASEFMISGERFNSQCSSSATTIVAGGAGSTGALADDPPDSSPPPTGASFEAAYTREYTRLRRGVWGVSFAIGNNSMSEWIRVQAPVSGIAIISKYVFNIES